MLANQPFTGAAMSSMASKRLDKFIGKKMDLNKPFNTMSPAHQHKVKEHLARAKQFGSPRNVWVEDGHVFVEGYDGEMISMTPATAIAMGRSLSEAGADAIVNQVIENNTATT